MNSENIFILPGWQNSGPQHWQSLWQTRFGYTRVEQHDWMRPLRGDWIARLECGTDLMSGPGKFRDVVRPIVDYSHRPQRPPLLTPARPHAFEGVG